MGCLSQTVKSYSCIDVVTKNGFAGFEVSIEQGLDSVTEKSRTKFGIALHTRLHRFLE